MSVHRIYIALEPSLDGKEPTAFKAVVLSPLVEHNAKTDGVKKRLLRIMKPDLIGVASKSVCRSW